MVRKPLLAVASALLLTLGLTGCASQSSSDDASASASESAVERVVTKKDATNHVSTVFMMNEDWGEHLAIQDIFCDFKTDTVTLTEDTVTKCHVDDPVSQQTYDFDVTWKFEQGDRYEAVFDLPTRQQ